ncbi:MAG: molecular chaperone DnaJ [Chitinophagaceae bacterium]|nr:MAG: molecular chaperone DnaJ [Chitinophagaceae bacterium]
MIITLLQTITDSTKMITETKNSAPAGASNHWIWIAGVELLVIGLLTVALLKKKKTPFVPPTGNLLSESRNAEIDMGSLMDNINQSRQLYKKLSVQCHPDRFAGDEHKRKIADELFQDITRYQRNYEKLLALQELAKQKLHINN